MNDSGTKHRYELICVGITHIKQIAGDARRKMESPKQAVSVSYLIFFAVLSLNV